MPEVNTSMEDTANNPSGTDSLTEAEAVSKLSGLLAARESGTASDTDENESVEDTQPQEVEDEATEEQAETHSDEDDAATESEEDDSNEQAETALGDDTPVEINGSTITLGELKKGHMLHADYTRKTQQHAEEVKAFTAQRDQMVSGLRGELAQRADMYAFVASQLAIPEPTQKEYEDDPYTHGLRMIEWNKQQQAIQGLLTERDNQARLAQEQRKALHAQEQAACYETFLSKHADLADATPILDRNGKPTYDRNGIAVTKGNQEVQRMWAYGVGLFDQETMALVSDPRMLEVLRKAELYDRNMAQQGKVKQQVAAKPALAKPGVSRGTADSSSQERARAMARLNKSGSVEDAIAALKLAGKRK